MNYLGFIFDLDGTLLNTLEDMANSMNRILERHGFSAHDVEKYKYFIGNGMEKMVKRTLPKDKTSDELVKICLMEFKEEYSKNWHKRTKPYEGINKLLYRIHSSKMKMSVLSNKPHDFTKLMIDNFFGTDYFEFVFGARKNVAKKPDPYAALEISRLSGISPDRYLYLGDTSVDMNTAHNAGMYGIGVTWGFRDEKELLESGAKMIIHNPHELLKFL